MKLLSTAATALILLGFAGAASAEGCNWSAKTMQETAETAPIILPQSTPTAGS